MILKSKLDDALGVKHTLGQPAFTEIFHNEIAPILISLRKENRDEKNRVEEKNKKIKELYRKLLTIQDACDCIEFEVDCLRCDVATIRNSIDSDSADKNGSDIDHETRMRLLDEEEIKRKELQRKLAALNDETKDIEIACSRKADQLNQVKPYIKILLDKVSPSLRDVMID